MGLFLGQFIPAVSNIWDGIHHRCFSFFFQNRVREKKNIMLMHMHGNHSRVYMSFIQKLKTM